MKRSLSNEFLIFRGSGVFVKYFINVCPIMGTASSSLQVANSFNFFHHFWIWSDGQHGAELISYNMYDFTFALQIIIKNCFQNKFHIDITLKNIFYFYLNILFPVKDFMGRWWHGTEQGQTRCNWSFCSGTDFQSYCWILQHSEQWKLAFRFFTFFGLKGLIIRTSFWNEHL